MSAGGVIPEPAARQPSARFVGQIGTLTVAVKGDRVVLYDLWEFDATGRDTFMRLWCEAERQAEASDG